MASSMGRPMTGAVQVRSIIKQSNVQIRSCIVFVRLFFFIISVYYICIFCYLQMYQDGSARPMTAVKAAGYTSSLSRGEFKVVCFIYCLLRVDND